MGSNALLILCSTSTPFKVVYISVSKHTVDLIWLPLFADTNPSIEKFAECVQRIHQEAKHNREDANLHYKTVVNQHWYLKLFKKGNLVIVHLYKHCFPQGSYNKLNDKKIGLF